MIRERTSAVNFFLHSWQLSYIFIYVLPAVGRDVVRRQANYTLNLPFNYVQRYLLDIDPNI